MKNKKTKTNKRKDYVLFFLIFSTVLGAGLGIAFLFQGLLLNNWTFLILSIFLIVASSISFITLQEKM
jgi:putative flippase GtrA